jgi:hypothetical protein
VAFACAITVSWSGLALAADAGEVGSIPLPGGVEGLRRALDDRVAMPPAIVGAELARRVYNGTAEATKKDPALSRLQAWLRACETTTACETATLRADLVPLPGPPEFWRETVLGGRVRPEHLMLGILGDRGASLLYTALLSLDADTRAWLVERPELVQSLSHTDRGALVVAAPFLRIRDGRWQLPGGAAADPIWMDLASARLEDSPAFLRALLRARGGLVAYMLEVVATLGDDQRASALALASANPDVRVAAGRALLDALRPATEFWAPGARPFWRPAIDPSLMLYLLPVDAQGRLAIPGGRKLWEMAFDEGELTPAAADADEAWRDRTPVSAAWLTERVGDGGRADQTIRYEQVLFASRHLTRAPASQAVAVVSVLRGYARFPQLFRVLERIGVADAAQLAAMARQAAALSAAGHGWRARAARLQWQCLIVLLDRAARTGAVTADDVRRAIDELAAMPADAAAAPAASGRWVRRLADWLHVKPEAANAEARHIEDALLAWLTASPTSADRRVTWEDSTYRLDFGAAERDRIKRVRGRDDRPLLDAAVALIALAGRSRPAADDLAALTSLITVARLDRVAAADDELGQMTREQVMLASRRLAGEGRRASSAAARAAIADAGEALATSALLELAYTVSMGWAEDLPLSAAAASRRHVFVRDASAAERDLSWKPPVVITDRKGPWHVAGSVLGLDVALAPVSLRRLSMRPLGAAPLLNTGDRALFVSTVAVLDRRAFSDEGQRLLVGFVNHARTRLSAVRSAEDARRAAAAATVSPLRQVLAAWIAARDPSDLAAFFSPIELLRMGLDGAPLPGELRGWGNFDAAFTGRLIAGDLPRLPWEHYAGRSGRLLAWAVPDLQLSLAIELAGMDLPAVLVPDLMASAMVDLVNAAPSRHVDDWQAMITRVQLLDREAVERHLGLLTTWGPLRAEPTHRSP